MAVGGAVAGIQAQDRGSRQSGPPPCAPGAPRHAQRVAVVVLGVLLIEPLVAASVLPVLPVAEPEAPMLVPLPVPDVDVSALVLGAAAEPEVVLDDDELSAPAVAGGVVVVDVDVEVSVSRWQADSDNAAIRARAAQRARGRLVIRTLLSGCRYVKGSSSALTGTLCSGRDQLVGPHCRKL